MLEPVSEVPGESNEEESNSAAASGECQVFMISVSVSKRIECVVCGASPCR